MVCHCLLIETEQAGLVLVDTGFGRSMVAAPERVPRAFRWVVGPVFSAEETAIAQIAALGYSPGDVRHIVLTHMDPDHAGGLVDFPWAIVHVHQREYLAAMRRSTANMRSRYWPDIWMHGPRWRTYERTGEQWMGFSAVRPLGGLDEDIALVPLAGHTAGHAGVAVRVGERWLLHAGDAYFYEGEKLTPPSSPVGLRLIQAIDAYDRAARLANLERLRALHASKGPKVDIFCSHDPSEWDQYGELRSLGM